MGDGFTCPATSTGDLKVLWNTRRSLEVPLAFDLGLVEISAVVNDAAAERGWFPRNRVARVGHRIEIWEHNCEALVNQCQPRRIHVHAVIVTLRPTSNARAHATTDTAIVFSQPTDTPGG